jgi:hypothetical protein
MTNTATRTCLAALAAILLLPALVAGQSATNAPAAKDKRLALVAPDDDAVIVYCEGLVKSGGVHLDIGSRIAKDATLVTGPDSFAEIVFARKNILRVGPGSVVKLDLAGLQRQVTLDQGTVGAVLRRLEKASGGSLSVRTPTSVAAVRGTTLFAAVDADAPDETYYCICNGRLELANTDGSNAVPQEANHHHAVTRKQTASGTEDSARGLRGHDDVSVEAMAGRIGEKMDWSAVED